MSDDVYCDGCHQPRRDVQACGKDDNGDPDAPCLCFVCRREAARGRVWRNGRYVAMVNDYDPPRESERR